MHTEISNCRICGNPDLIPILSLGQQFLTGVFPKNRQETVPCGPIELVKCHGNNENDFCGLLQLKHSYEPDDLYGDNYGYRSGLNESMVSHLHRKVEAVCRSASLQAGDLIVDIGSNDSTLLRGYPENEYYLVGIDPTGAKFREFYPHSVTTSSRVL